MCEFPPLNLAQLDPLQNTLIEASAGTGKTWTMTQVYLRLILEYGWLPEQILLVTFTNDATAELKQRIRALLLQQLTQSQAGTEDQLIRRLLASGQTHAELQGRLRRALRQFDDAAIYTIHGFCQRVLSEHAFASAQPLVREIAGNDDDLLYQVTADFWRCRLPDCHPLLLPQLLRQYKGAGPYGLANSLRPWLARPYLQVDKPVGVDLDASIRALDQAYLGFAACWQQSHQSLQDFLINSADLCHKSFNKRNVPRWCAQASAWLDKGCWSLQEKAPFFDYLVPEKVQNNLKGPCDLGPVLPLLQAIATMRDAISSAHQRIADGLAAFYADALEQVGKELRQRKQQLRQVSFNDLLLDLDTALQGNDANRLLKQLRAQYRIALIDEFQDTDPLQYGIFRRIFRDGGLPMTLVGDPKQAIYSFRGADVTAYLHARAEADKVYTMETNWRSVPELVGSFNALFAGSHDLFHADSIRYQQMQASERQHRYLLLDGQRLRPLRFVCLNGEDGQALGKTEAVNLALDECARDIARLLQQSRAGRLVLHSSDEGSRPVRANDIAVLLPKHHQVGYLQASLQSLGVASVRQARESVFATFEAEELQRLLQAIAEPFRSASLRAALATRMVGQTARDLLDLQQDDEVWQQWVERFQRYQRLWQQQGMMPALWSCLSELRIPPRLLQGDGGERALTNLLHLAELLHQQAGEAHLDILASLNWLQQQRHAPEGAGDAALLRLESDDERVQLMTVHVSKGLEFPLVFCPVLWHGSDFSPGDAVLWHDPEQDNKARLSLVTHPQIPVLQQASREYAAEQMRLAYVALTRASSFCSVTVVETRGLEQTPLNWWLDPHQQYADWSQRLSGLLAAYPQGIELQSAAAPPDDVGSAEDADQADLRQAREFTGRIPRRRLLTSFSALFAGHSPDLPDYDHHDRHRSEASTGIHAFPRGARSGRCLHAIYEHWDFTSGDRTALQEQVSHQLKVHGFEPGWQEIITANVEAVLSTPLGPEEGFCLAAISPSRRLNELEFHFPLASTGLQTFRRQLQGVLTATDLPQMPALCGYMKGYIDLVFEFQGRYYLVDYKSNWLGPDAQAYHSGTLQAVMHREGYLLQSLIYVIALHRLLSLRVPDYSYEHHFGGVRYLFLRGMSGAGKPELGVFADRPDPGLIERLNRALASESC